MTKALMHRSPGDISVIKFDGARVRIVKINGEPWFIAADVCAALEITDHKVALRRLDSDEKGECSIPTPGGMQAMRTVCESGFYKLISRSRKASTPGTFAHRFSNWIFRDVIPTIRKTGAYGVPFALLNDFSKREAAYRLEASKRGYRLQQCKDAKEELKNEERELWRRYQPDFLECGNHE
ncbi:antirepressor protein [Salmonella enterica]|uniref:Antirepressor protein n=2 Tax=Salmonella enterica I TaxID=59201 RepID=A0A5X8XTG4_SALNE|nr:BRO family protein [Salmonella enterica]EBR7993979.1 antirepressor protein [Salmonella enterica subsp. enterica serovar Panama]EBV0461889.1 antirepressor protein [Salmonella enterica subsp. enterica serovar Newport]ASD84870.1 antirepressor protein [Salmonella enterica subsp. enterica serovar India str. SA20085604]EAW2934216.1 antirepressor protein [Salmonella enterica]EBR8434533.1 antirepressor protein [Salmonella enterica subsp. enterica serovar Panama]